MKPFLVVLGWCLIAAACQFSPTSPSPLAVVAPATVVAPQPAPRPVVMFAPVFTELAVGSRLQRTVVSDSNPDCDGLPGWGCQYFRITPTTDGVLSVVVDWVVETQPHQTLDLTIQPDDGVAIWADFLRMGALGLRDPVRAGRTYQIVVWYTFPGLRFEVSASMDTP